MDYQRELDEVNEEIALIKNRLEISHSLGDNNSAKGINAGFSDNKYWDSKLSKLKQRRNALEMLVDGKRPPMPNILQTRLVE